VTSKSIEETNQPVSFNPRHYQSILSRQRSLYRKMTESDWWITTTLRKATEDAASKFANGLLVDIGCGGRAYSELFAPYIDRYLGLDIYASGNNLPDVYALAQALPLASESADVVLMSQVLEHLPEPWNCVSEAARVLKPGGVVIVSAPQTWMLHEKPFDFYRYSPFGLHYLCRHAGLNVVMERALGNGWTTLLLSTFLQGAWNAAALLKMDRTWHNVKQETFSQKRSIMGTMVSVCSAIPFLVLNVCLSLLDRLPDAGVYSAQNLIVAQKPLNPS